MSDKGMDKEDFDGLIAGLRHIAAYERGEREGFVTHTYDQIKEGLNEALAFAQGQETGAVVHQIEVPNFKAKTHPKSSPERGGGPPKSGGGAG